MLKEAERGYRTIQVTPEPSGFGARITGLDLSKPLPDAVLADVRTEVVPFGFGGRSLSRGIESALERPDFEPGALQRDEDEDWERGGWERE